MPLAKVNVPGRCLCPTGLCTGTRHQGANSHSPAGDGTCRAAHQRGASRAKNKELLTKEVHAMYAERQARKKEAKLISDNTTYSDQFIFY